MTTNNFYPIAGCAALAHRQAADYHHRWLVIDEAGNWLSVETCPALKLITTDIKMGYLVMRAPGMLRMDIPLDVIEDDDSVKRVAQIAGQAVEVVDEGDLAAVWFGHVTGIAARLVKIHPDAPAVNWPG